ncbi:MAG: cache domain-containing protein, partial [Alphaproteobacteria bacterium]|nr:cache domain-containing protein [Alphaproteobacteria bacterium]
MMQKETSPPEKLELKVIAFIFAAFLSGCLVVGGLFTFHTDKLFVQSEINKLEYSARLVAPRFTETYSNISQDVSLLAKMPPIKGIMRARYNDGKDPFDGSTEQLWRDRLATIFTSMLKLRPNYAQIRYIGAEDDGKEIVRVDRRGGEIIRRPEGALQSKADEPYFKEVLRLPLGELYFSDITLNRENGKISFPHEPMLRVGTPVYNDEGKAFGFVIINISYWSFIQDLHERFAGSKNLYVVNAKGQYLVHPDPRKEFGFERGRGATVEEDFPELQSLRGDFSKGVGFFNENARKYAYYFQVPYDDVNPDHFLGILLTLPEDVALRQSHGVLTIMITVLGVLLAMFAMCRV